jgi:hypothetical protein
VARSLELVELSRKVFKASFKAADGLCRYNIINNKHEHKSYSTRENTITTCEALRWKADKAKAINTFSWSSFIKQLFTNKYKYIIIPINVSINNIMK